MNKAREAFEKETGQCAMVMMCKGQHDAPVPVKAVATDDYLKWLESRALAAQPGMGDALKVCEMLLKYSKMKPGVQYEDVGGKTDFEYLAEDIIPLAAEMVNYSVYYCVVCAQKYNLGFGMQPKASEEELAAGYCMVCGVAAPYIGHVKRNNPKLPKEIVYDRVVKAK